MPLRTSLIAIALLASPQEKKLPEPTHADVAYGTHERNVLDVWVAKSDKPAPLLVYIHGGGQLPLLDDCASAGAGPRRRARDPVPPLEGCGMEPGQNPCRRLRRVG